MAPINIVIIGVTLPVARTTYVSQVSSDRGGRNIIVTYHLEMVVVATTSLVRVAELVEVIVFVTVIDDVEVASTDVVVVSELVTVIRVVLVTVTLLVATTSVVIVTKVVCQTGDADRVAVAVTVLHGGCTSMHVHRTLRTDCLSCWMLDQREAAELSPPSGGPCVPELGGASAVLFAYFVCVPVVQATVVTVVTTPVVVEVVVVVSVVVVLVVLVSVSMNVVA
jgi:hypothetical protein